MNLSPIFTSLLFSFIELSEEVFSDNSHSSIYLDNLYRFMFTTSTKAIKPLPTSKWECNIKEFAMRFLVKRSKYFIKVESRYLIHTQSQNTSQWNSQCKRSPNETNRAHQNLDYKTWPPFPWYSSSSLIFLHLLSARQIKGEICQQLNTEFRGVIINSYFRTSGWLSSECQFSRISFTCNEYSFVFRMDFQHVMFSLKVGMERHLKISVKKFRFAEIFELFSSSYIQLHPKIWRCQCQ